MNREAIHHEDAKIAKGNLGFLFVGFVRFVVRRSVHVR